MNIFTAAVIKQQTQNAAKQQAMIQQAITQQAIRTAPWQQAPASGPMPSSMAPMMAPEPMQQVEQQRQLLEAERASAAEQIKQSETNLAAHFQNLMQQQQVCWLYRAHF